MTSELKPCPFCGSKARMWPSQTKSNKDGSYEIIGCSNVYCLIGPTTDEYLPYEEAISSWNTRAVPDLPELVRYDKSDICLAIENGYDALPSDGGEYVLHSQAAAIIAAKDAEIERIKDENPMRDSLQSHWVARYTRMKQRAEAAEAKLAQYEAQEPVGCVYGGNNGDGTYSPAYWGQYPLPEYITPHKDFPAVPLYSSPAPCPDLKAENERLREALTGIASLSQSTDLLWWQVRAREALQERGKE